MSRLAVIGAGAMGLAAAYHAAKVGHSVTVYEAGDRPGGMAAHFDFGGLSIERYYHFICKSDQATFDLLADLGIADRLRWRATSMGYFIDGTLYAWGTPLALLRFPLLSLYDRIRYGLQMFRIMRATDFDAIEHRAAAAWFRDLCGKRAYSVLWHQLLDLKFFEYADTVSASWMATRIRRVGRSRRSIFQEELGYLEGGSETLVTALSTAIERLGGRIRLSARVEEVVARDGKVRGVSIDGAVEPADHVISTVPTPLIERLVPALSEATRKRYRAIDNIGIVCVVLKLKRRVTRHFWVNINDPSIALPGIIEFSNLRPVDPAIVFIPYYMPHGHSKWAWTDRDFIVETMACIKKINPEIRDSDLIDHEIGRLRHAQPICEPGFREKLPPIQTEIAGLQIADTCFYYPEDRGISESVRLGKAMAEAVI